MFARSVAAQVPVDLYRNIRLSGGANGHEPRINIRGFSLRATSRSHLPLLLQGFGGQAAF